MRTLFWSPAFKRSFRRFAKKNPTAREAILRAIQTLSDDPFNPSLSTHKLKGELQGAWACKAGYDLRIVFEFVENGILLLAVGSHEEVY